MFTNYSFDNRLASVKNALEPSTRKPPVPSDRKPTIQRGSPKKSNQCAGFISDDKENYTQEQLRAHRLWKSMIMMLGSFIERAPQSQQWTRSEIREFLTQVEICLELKPGKLSIPQYGNLVVKLDAIAPFKDGELAQDLTSLEQMVAAYGDKLAAEG